MVCSNYSGVDPIGTVRSGLIRNGMVVLGVTIQPNTNGKVHIILKSSGSGTTTKTPEPDLKN